MIEVKDLCIQQGEFSLKDVSFRVDRGQYAILMGRTGSGKTTVLEAICGLKPLVSGQIILSERDVTHLTPAERGIGFVPQDGALFPTMTVREQLGFSLSVRREKATVVNQRVDELAELLGIGYLLDRRPHGLSGGEVQRVALGRALAPKPGVLCLDEPLSALDEATLEEMYQLIKSVCQRTGVTTLHITHSKTEADRLGDVVMQIQDGVVVPLETRA
ncbi:MAG: ABC transporter ATP-binding protein [Planctomycetaceae bacterium]|nr:ABC transporter ATP-binding protein [Planctomycetaceae bacterium]